MKIIGGKPSKRPVKPKIRCVASALAACAAVSFFTAGAARNFDSFRDTAAIAAAGFVFPEGLLPAAPAADPAPDPAEPPSVPEISGQSSVPESSPEPSSESETPSESPPSSQPPQSAAEASGLSSQEPSSEPEEPSSQAAEQSGIPIQEVQIGNTGVQFGDIFVKNATSVTLDIESELAQEPAVSIKADGTPEVLIYHTHTTESYLLWEQDEFLSGTPTRSQDETQSVILVGDAIAAQLRAAGIGVIHDTTCHDYPAYNGAYDRSAVTMQKNLEKYPGIQVTLDIHRDAIGDNSVRKKPTVTIDGKKAAQIMILSGCDSDGSLGFPDWEQNLRLGLRVQQTLAESYPGLARPLNFCERLYNLNMTKGSLLVEFGTEVNTLDEALYSGELFGRSLAETLLALR